MCSSDDNLGYPEATLALLMVVIVRIENNAGVN